MTEDGTAEQTWLRSIVLGYTPEPLGLAAAARAIHLARRDGARLTVVNTGRRGDYSDPVFADEADIDALVRRMRAEGIEPDVRRPHDGRSAADSILSVARETDADLVVIGVRRRSPVGKMMTGSTAQQVILEAPCSVLAVRART